jgi:2-polyprenyl-3-methyl-5-hydroxy-6-metoxy-1,4-benzoquinol methylase
VRMTSILRETIKARARTFDALMMRLVGIPYTLLTRDWLMHERARYLAQWAGRVQGQLRILDAGCGSGLSFMYLQRHAAKVKSYIGIDLDTSRPRRRYRDAAIPHDFIDLDLDSPWTLGSFELIFASEVIEHIVEDRRLLARLGKHLAPNGVLVLTTPNKCFVQRVAQTLRGFDKVSAYQDGGHVHVGYAQSELTEMAHENWLVPIATSYLGKISLRELRKRQSLRSGADFANTARFNLAWLVRNVLGRNGCSVIPDQYWSIAIAFQNCSDMTNPVQPMMEASA